jgi:His-Xaa-Ser system radical SAM maturase HxsB
MRVWPLQFRKCSDGELLFSDDSGAFFRATEAFLERYVGGQLADPDSNFLIRQGHAFASEGDPSFVSYAARWARSINPARELNYFILVPTLRCNLMCDYCQVSRAAENAKGFDWDQAKLDQVIALLDEQQTTEIKIEFQGGEPLLRLDALEAIRSFCRKRFETSQFVVCTNLQNVSDEAWRFLESEDTHISTSFDGTPELHQEHRTKSEAAHSQFNSNLDLALSRFGPDKVSALPTIDPFNPPSPEGVINAFASRGLNSIFLRRINYQGFARKKYDFDGAMEKWRTYYQSFVRALIAYNASASEPLEEYYLSHALRRILQGGHHNHVDLRNPNWLGVDYLVIDFDGRFYPTDEARMVSRVGQIDLCIGSLAEGMDEQKVAGLNLNASNFDDPDCIHCVYRPYCGLDLIDDLSRYGRVDVPRHTTDHCRSHLDLFDFAFELLYSDDPIVHQSLSHWLNIPRYSHLLAPRLT